LPALFEIALASAPTAISLPELPPPVPSKSGLSEVGRPVTM
jgi:hypothetical protein